MAKATPRTELTTSLELCRPVLVWAGIFSFFINMLMLVPSLYMLQIYDRVLGSRSVNTLVGVTVVSVALIGIYAILEAVRSQILVRVGGRLDELLSGRVFAAIFKVALRRPDIGTSQALRDLDAVREFLAGQGLLAFFDAPWLPIYLACVYIIHPALGVIATIGAVLIFAVALVNEFATRTPLREATAQTLGASRFVDTSLRNVEAVEAMGMLGGIYDKWQSKRLRTVDLQGRASDRAGGITAISRFIRLVLQMVILGVGAYYVLQDQITAGLMIVASILMGRALAPIEMAVAMWRQFVGARAAYARLNELLRGVPPPPDTMPLPVPQGHIAVDNVIVAAPGGQVPILRGVNLRVAAGDVIGIIGPSAAGKSTLARALAGVWPVHAGTVRIDGADINTWDRNRLGPHIGYLPQDVELFEGTIAENIARFGAVDPDAAIAAATRAGVHQLILNLPNGYDTVIGPGGMTLSGGQRQRIALARALYNDPPIIVLDEPNSNLDTEGEGALAEALTALKAEGRTVFVITHRVHILSRVDYIMALNQGVIETFGTRDQVLSQFLKPVAEQSNRASPVGPQPGYAAAEMPRREFAMRK